MTIYIIEYGQNYETYYTDAYKSREDAQKILEIMKKQLEYEQIKGLGKLNYIEIQERSLF
jgi:hypothetical protein